MSQLNFELSLDEKIVYQGKMIHRISTFQTDNGIGVITNKRFMFFNPKTNFGQKAIKGAVGLFAGEIAGLAADFLIKGKYQLSFEIAGQDLRSISAKNVGLQKGVNINDEHVLLGSKRDEWMGALVGLKDRSV